MKKGGWGIVYQEVMRNSDLSVEAKAIYAYLSSIAGSGNTCYPAVETIQRDLNIGKNRLMKHMAQLIATGVVEKVRERNGNIYGHNVYKITHESEVIKDLNCIFGAVENEAVEIQAVEIQAVENEATNNNNSNNNSLNNNNIDYSKIATLYNTICVSFPKLTKISDKRKKTIRARFNQGYTISDFTRLFEMAECSTFLKGGNNKNWQATFDWLITDANMAKVLDGNYANREGGEEGADDSDKERRPASDYYLRYFKESGSD